MHEAASFETLVKLCTEYKGLQIGRVKKSTTHYEVYSRLDLPGEGREELHRSKADSETPVERRDGGTLTVSSPAAGHILYWATFDAGNIAEEQLQIHLIKQASRKMPSQCLAEIIAIGPLELPQEKAMLTSLLHLCYLLHSNISHLKIGLSSSVEMSLAFLLRMLIRCCATAWTRNSFLAAGLQKAVLSKGSHAMYYT